MDASITIDWRHHTPNPFEGIETSEVKSAVWAIDDLKEKIDALIADFASQHVEGVDIGGFSTHIDDAFGDTLGASKYLAECVLQDRGKAE